MSKSEERKSPIEIEWSDSLSVDSKVIDFQHKKIVKALNELVVNINTGQDHDTIGETIDKLVECTQRHFITEESFMEAYGYPDIESHTIRHNEFIQRMTEYNKLYKTNAIGVVKGVTIFIEHWFENHIVKEDMGYKSYLSQS